MPINQFIGSFSDFVYFISKCNLDQKEMYQAFEIRAIVFNSIAGMTILRVVLLPIGFKLSMAIV